ncbi:MAG: DUF2155 domain-containing protein [Alphaproteobacteria bacterium]|nr:DUF2155 domain-containing protein [Alphaproteobacteria bacterium]
MRNFYILIFVCTALQCEPVKFVSLAVLDKVTTKAWVVNTSVKASIDVRRLQIKVHECEAPPASSFYPDQERCFVEVVDKGIVEDGEPSVIFSQWMFVNYPFIAALDHPRYDVWLIGCSQNKKG